ncbi:MAG: hypothetical protein QXH62_02360 [Candidatus Bathyarchaeia archaeon]
MNLRDSLELSRELRAFSRILMESAKTLNNTTSVIKSVKCLTGGSRSSNIGSKLITAGMACIVFPEPLFSDVVGSMLIATGMLLKSRRGPTIADIFKETRRIMVGLKRINMEL